MRQPRGSYQHDDGDRQQGCGNSRGKTTVVRRYAPGSVKFDDAKPSSLAEIHPGDQLRARGTHSEDGATFTADEIVTGSFRNIAGTVSAIDTSAGTMTVMDLASNKPVEIKLTGESQLRKLPQPMAQRIAIRLKGVTPEASASGARLAAILPERVADHRRRS